MRLHTNGKRLHALQYHQALNADSVGPAVRKKVYTPPSAPGFRARHREDPALTIKVFGGGVNDNVGT